jgi:hypothetical protein
VKRGDMECLKQILRCHAAGFDGLCGKGSMCRRLARLADEGFTHFVGAGPNYDEVGGNDREWPIWELTAAGRSILLAAADGAERGGR